MARKKKELTPAQKAAARRNPGEPKQEKPKKVNNLNDDSPLGSVGATFVLMFVVLGCIFAFLYLNGFFGMAG